MSAKTTGEETDITEAEEHEFLDMGPEFRAQLAPYLDSPDKVELMYWACIKDGVNKDIKFKRTKLVPSAAVERAKRDKDFNYKFAHAIALAYQREILTSGNYPCSQCGKPATGLVQSPMTDYTGDLMIQDIAVATVCDNRDCVIKARGESLDIYAQLGSFLDSLKAEGIGVDIPSIEDPARICLGCGTIEGESKLRTCSRCKRAYFCNRECQSKAWKKHKKDCRPPEST